MKAVFSKKGRMVKESLLFIMEITLRAASRKGKNREKGFKDRANAFILELGITINFYRSRNDKFIYYRSFNWLWFQICITKIFLIKY